MGRYGWVGLRRVVLVERSSISGIKVDMIMFKILVVIVLEVEIVIEIVI
jgi:hypothetical protein